MSTLYRNEEWSPPVLSTLLLPAAKVGNGMFYFEFQQYFLSHQRGEGKISRYLSTFFFFFLNQDSHMTLFHAAFREFEAASWLWKICAYRCIFTFVKDNKLCSWIYLTTLNSNMTWNVFFNLCDLYIQCFANLLDHLSLKNKKIQIFLKSGKYF